MRAQAPGKVVISGAYAVLEGAPALVTAVDRYVIADTSVEATFEAPEARAAIPSGPLPQVDVSSLWCGDRKLGLGSSAAIVVASLAAVMLEQQPDLCTGELASRVWQPARSAHRAAQGGGSGVDVVTSALGGTRRCWLDGETLHSEAHCLPAGLEVQVFAARESASTRKMLALVRAWAERDPLHHRDTTDALCEASKNAVQASDIGAFVRAMADQRMHLTRMGNRSGAPIVPLLLRSIAEEALEDGVAVHPSGAGGGDIVLCMGDPEGCHRWGAILEGSGFLRLGIRIGALGVHQIV
jgi:phosphomevalonate kinase